MKKAAGAVALMLGLVLSTSALGWGWQGHEAVGNIAAGLLTPKASAAVNGLLRGHTLAEASTWADCAKSVVKTKTGRFVYQHTQYTPGACTTFETPAETPYLVDFAQRNWSNCVYTKTSPCHGAFHFADVAVQNDHYARTFVGTNDHDLVSAISACVTVLRGGVAPAPFNIKDKTEALFLLTHYVGDLHQPLHVSAVYLTPDGKLVNPDANPPLDPNTETAGGNLIQDGHNNLHHDWDEIPSALGPTPSADMLKAAAELAPTAGDPASWPVVWAGDTVMAGHTAFANLTFAAAAGGKGWTVDTTADPQYVAHRAELQKTQIVKGGRRLADLLNDIFS